MNKCSIFDTRVDPFEKSMLEDLLKQNTKYNITYSHVPDTRVDVAARPTGYEVYICDLAQGAEFVEKNPTIPMEVDRFGCADVIMWDGYKWIPRILIKEAIERILVEYAKNFDLRMQAVLIGEGVGLRLIAGMALEFGYKEIKIFGESMEDLNHQKDFLQRKFLGVKVHCLLIHELTLQKTGASFIANILNLDKRKELATDLAYFNFMGSQGVFADLSTTNNTQNIFEEARKANLTALRPELFHKKWNQLFSKKINEKFD